MKVNSPEDAEVIIQKLSSDMGIHRNPRKGTLDAPEKIFEGLEFDRPVLVDEVFPDEFDLEETHDSIYDNTLELAEYSKPVISIGGDHSVSYPVIKALKQENPEMKLVWLDSHLDLKEKVDNHVSHDVVVRQLVEEGLFEPGEVYFVGYTRVDEDEEEYLQDKGFRMFKAGELSGFLDEVGEELIYLSVDIDVLKQELAPGTGYPDGELKPEEVNELIEKLNIKHADLVEVAPTLDQDRKTLTCSENLITNLVESTCRN